MEKSLGYRNKLRDSHNSKQGDALWKRAWKKTRKQQNKKVKPGDNPASLRSVQRKQKEINVGLVKGQGDSKSRKENINSEISAMCHMAALLTTSHPAFVPDGKLFSASLCPSVCPFVVDDEGRGNCFCW